MIPPLPNTEDSNIITIDLSDALALIKLSCEIGKYDNARAVLEDIIKAFEKKASNATG